MDDVPVVVERAAQSAKGSRDRRSSRLPLVIGALAVAGVVLFAIGGGQAPATVPEPSAPPVTAPTQAPEPETVDATLDWAASSGLENAGQIVGVVDLPTGVAAVGLADGQLSSFLTSDGLTWERGGLSEVDVTEAYVAQMDGAAAVVANRHHPVNGPLAPLVLKSSDGRDWEATELPVPEGDSALVGSAFGSGETVTIKGLIRPGREDTAALWGTLPDSAAELVADGRATTLVSGGGVVEVRLGPLLVHSRRLTPEEASGWETPSDVDWVTWTAGPDVIGVAPDATPATYTIGRLGDGRLVGMDGERLVTSADGTTWEPGPTEVRPWGATVWGDLVIGPSPSGESLMTWDSVTGQERVVTPDRLLGKSSLMRLSAGGSGLAAVVVFPQLGSRGDVETVVGRDGDVDWVLTDVKQILELRRGSEVVEQVPVFDTVGSVDGDEIVIEVGGNQLRVEIDDWLETVADIGSSTYLQDAAVLHTSDGTAWSSTPASELAGSQIWSPVAFVTDRFVLVDEQTPAAAGPGRAWVGTPLG